tara:strand:- start:331 stop:1113 length:783 start_codon:yes stop_codon:yes gene_type:complete
MRFLIKEPARAAQLTAMFTQLKSFADLIVLRPGEEGVWMQCMDAAQVCLFDSILSASWFDEYECPEADGESSTTAGVGVVPRVMAMVLGTWREGQSIEVKADTSDKLTVTLAGDPNHLDKFFEVQRVDSDAETLDLSGKGESQIDLVLATKRMTELVGQLLIFDSVLRVEFGEDSISFESQGEEGALKVDVALDDVTEYAILTPLNQQFSLSYLQTMCGFGKLAPEIMMKFSKDQPMEVRYELGDKSHATLYLAPKIADD